MKDKQKCSVSRCREEKEITLPDGTGLCWKHWGERCENKEKDALNQTKQGLEGQEKAGNTL